MLYSHSIGKFVIIRRSLVTKVPSIKFPTEKFNAKVSYWMQMYEEFVGLTEVKAAQSRVLDAETKFVKSQEERREVQRQITSIQSKLHDLHTELDRTPRGEDKYLTLITQEHTVLRDEKYLRENFQSFEKEERENFAALSHAVRDSHEKERAQAEKTKYWSIIGSVIGTIIGIVGTTFNNRMRMQELRNLVEDTANKSNSKLDIQELAKEISTLIVTKSNTTTLIPSSSLLNRNRNGEEKVEQQMTDEQWQQLLVSVSNIVDLVGKQQTTFQEQNQKLEVLIARVKKLDFASESEQVHFFASEREVEQLLNHNQKYFTNIIFASSLIIPICTWALCKFV